MRRAFVVVLVIAAGGCDGDAPASSTDGGVTADAVAAGPRLVLPEVIDLPFVTAGAGGTEITVTVRNLGDREAVGSGGGDLTWALTGDGGLSLVAAPARVAAGGEADLTLAWAGAPAETIAAGLLVVDGAETSAQAPVYAVAGDPALGAAAWEEVTTKAGARAGEGITIGLPAAPFPDGAAPWTDDHVRIFLPDGFRPLAVAGAGPLAAVATFGYGGPGAPYAEDYPDALIAVAGAEVLLTYDNGRAAAVGRAGRGALVGFPLELIDDPAARAAVIAALIGFVAP